jgi:hypothetical protein
MRMSSNSVTPKASCRLRVTASLFSCGIMKSSLGIGIEKPRRKTASSSVAKPPFRPAFPLSHVRAGNSGEPTLQKNCCFVYVELTEGGIEIDGHGSPLDPSDRLRGQSELS